VQQDLFAVQVHCVVETTGREHLARLRSALEEVRAPSPTTIQKQLWWRFFHEVSSGRTMMLCQDRL